jgi:hypothetical protein
MKGLAEIFRVPYRQIVEGGVVRVLLEEESDDAWAFPNRQPTLSGGRS